MNNCRFSLPLDSSVRDMMQDRCLIDGAWVGEPKDPVHDPANGALLGHVPRLGASEASTAVAAAEAALGAWSRWTAGKRAEVLIRWEMLIQDHRESLARLLTAEQGKPIRESRAELDYAASFVRYYAEEARRIAGEIIPAPQQDQRIFVTRQAVGVVAAITPWNFPAAMVTRKLAPAFAAGCTVVLKPAPETPFTALALAQLAQHAGLLDGVLNVVTGDAAEIGHVLTSHPAVRLVTFTGSTVVGKLLMRQASETVKKVALELGGNAPFIVFEDADLERAVEGALVAKFRNMGQTCVCANRIYVQDTIHDRFVAALSARVADLRVGNGMDEATEQGPLINARALEKVERHVSDAVAQGARVETGGSPHPLGGTFYRPTVLSGMKPTMLAAQEETFGPVAPIFRFKDEAEMIAEANGTPSGLAGYFYTAELARAFRVAEKLECGMVGVNTGAISTEVAPFGGIKESGLGREGSHLGLEEYLEVKYVMMDIA